MKKKKAACVLMAVLMLCGTSVVKAEEGPGSGQAAESMQEEDMNQKDASDQAADAGQTEAADQAADADQTDNTELSEGQRKASVKVVSITGNELSYYEIPEESENTSTASGGESPESAEKNPASEQADSSEEDRQANGGIPEGFAPGQTGDGEIPEGFASGQTGDGEIPEGFAPGQTGDGEIPEGFAHGQTGDSEMPEGFVPGQTGDGKMPEGFDPGWMRNGEMPEGFDPGQMRGSRPGSSDSGQPEDGSSFQGRGNKSGRMNLETKTVYLPVSVVVHTDLDAEMTFSILKAGDELEVLFEEDEDGEEMITEIWLKSTESGTV